MNPKQKQPKIVYPTFKMQQRPTPADTLWVCDSCNMAAWNNDMPIAICHNKPQHASGKYARMRRAMAGEIVEAKAALQDQLKV